MWPGTWAVSVRAGGRQAPGPPVTAGRRCPRGDRQAGGLGADAEPGPRGGPGCRAARQARAELDALGHDPEMSAALAISRELRPGGVQGDHVPGQDRERAGQDADRDDDLEEEGALRGGDVIEATLREVRRSLADSRVRSRGSAWRTRRRSRPGRAAAATRRLPPPEPSACGARRRRGGRRRWPPRGSSGRRGPVGQPGRAGRLGPTPSPSSGAAGRDRRSGAAAAAQGLDVLRPRSSSSRPIAGVAGVVLTRRRGRRARPRAEAAQMRARIAGARGRSGSHALPGCAQGAAMSVRRPVPWRPATRKVMRFMFFGDGCAWCACRRAC